MDLSDFLGEPDGRRLCTEAIKAVFEARKYTWYDSVFLYRFAAAQAFLRNVRPERLNAFTAAFEPLRTNPAFKVRHIDHVLAEDELAAIRSTIVAISSDDLRTSSNSAFEERVFGRKLYRNHPSFDALQTRLLAKVSEWAGEEVVATYNFLSLYHAMGVCPPHMDEPLAKWTLDLCIDQNVEWPIHFSQAVPWPEHIPAEWAPDMLKDDPSLRFDDVILHPNEAAFFSGSSQWHYRNPLPAREASSFCTLLFFHFTSAVGAPLASPQHWADYFDLPELHVLNSVLEKHRAGMSQANMELVANKAV